MAVKISSMMGDGSIGGRPVGGAPDMNPALRHAMAQGKLNVPPSDKCIRIDAMNGRAYYMPIDGKYGPTPLGLAFEVLYSRDQITNAVVRSGGIQFVGVGFTMEEVSFPDWWHEIEGLERAARIKK